MPKSDIPPLPEKPTKFKHTNETNNAKIFDVLFTIIQMHGEVQGILFEFRKEIAKLQGISSLFDLVKMKNTEFLKWQMVYFDFVGNIIDYEFKNDLINHTVINFGSGKSLMIEFSAHEVEKIMLLSFVEVLRNRINLVKIIPTVRCLTILSLFMKILYNIDDTKSNRLIDKLINHNDQDDFKSF